MPAGTVVDPRPEIRDSQGSNSGDWIVIVFNNEYNTFDQVIGILREATGCSRSEAEMETWEVHHLGRSIVHHAEKEECDRVAAIIATIGIRVAVDQV